MNSIAFINSDHNALLSLNGNPVGSANGYVALGKDHPLFGKSYDELEEMGIYAHGGLTFSAVISSKAISRLTELAESGVEIRDIAMPLNDHFGVKAEDVWVIGFDTCHCGDNATNWPLEAVQREAEALKEQLDNYLQA